MSRDDKLREVVKQMRFGSPPRHVLDWADRIEGALSEPVAELTQEAREAIRINDIERKECERESDMRVWCCNYDPMRAWIREVTGE